MKKILYAALMATMIVTMTGCGSSSPPPVTTQVLSDSTYDGDISFDGINYIPTPATQYQSVRAGIDPASLTEYRAFLDFPLTGAVPGSAFINSAVLDIFINNTSILPSSGTMNIGIDLVSFPPSTLMGSDFYLNALDTMTIPMYQSDLGQHVLIDVTPLMQKAQQLGLPDFQIRVLEEPGAVSPGFIDINDPTVPNTLSPLLEVTYS